MRAAQPLPVYEQSSEERDCYLAFAIEFRCRFQFVLAGLSSSAD